MNQETPPTPPLSPEAHASASPSRVTNGEPHLPEGRASVSPSPAANGDPSARTTSRAPASSRRARPRAWSSQRKTLTALVGGSLGALLVVLCLLWWTGSLFGQPPFNGPTWTVRKERLKIAIVERGSLESAKNSDVVCTVKAGTKGGTISTTIKWLVDAGAKVTKGEKIMELDSSGLLESLQSQTIDVDQAKAALVKADEDYRIQELENEMDIEKAKNALKLAGIDLKKYNQGEYPQAKKDILGRIETAKSDLESWKDRAAWSARMVKKGLMSKVQAEADQSKLEAAQFALQKVQEELRVLEDLTYGIRERTVMDLTSKRKEANLSLEKAKSQAKSKIAQKEADRLAARSVYEQKLSKKKEIEGEITKCVIYAPQDGLVVYYVPDQVRGGGGTQQSIVSQGEPVREGQKMLQIPDLSKMMVNVRVHEALVAHLYKKKRQPAEIRVDAFPNRILRGHVKMVDTIASQQDWFASDVKVYKTLVTIDESMEGLKPGMSAEVTIYAEESSEPVLVVPVQSVVGTISMGAERKCFVVGPDGQPQLRDIVVGMSNERVVEVKSGLKEGERVVQNPQPLLDAKSEMRPGRGRAHGDEEGEKAGGEGGPKKKDGAKGPGGFKGPKGPKGPAGANPGPNPGAGGPPADAQQKLQALLERLRTTPTPEQRRDIIASEVPAQFRATVRDAARAKGLKIAD